MKLDKQLLFGMGLTRSQKIQKGFITGVQFGGFGVVQDIALLGFQANRAGRGAMVSSLVGQGIGLGIGVPIAGVASSALCLIPGIGPLAGAIIGNLIAGYPELVIGTNLTRAIKTFTGIHKNIRHLEMGGNYVDTESASRQRMIALQDMNAATIPARRYLGQEALLMHR